MGENPPTNVPNSPFLSCLHKWLETKGYNGDNELKAWLLVPMACPDARCDIKESGEHYEVGRNVDLACTIISDPQKLVNSAKCGISAELIFELFQRNPYLKPDGMPEDERLVIREASIDDFETSAMSPKANSLFPAFLRKDVKSKAYLLNVIDAHSKTRDGHGITFERYVVNGVPYYHVYNGWVDRQSLFQSMVGTKAASLLYNNQTVTDKDVEESIATTAIANQPMTEAQFSRFIKAMKSPEDFHRLFLNVDVLHAAGIADAMIPVEALDVFKRVILKEYDGPEDDPKDIVKDAKCKVSWFPTFNMFSRKANSIIRDLKKYNMCEYRTTGKSSEGNTWKEVSLQYREVS